MGIKNLKNILVSKCSSAIVQRKLSSYNGMIIGIDLSIFLYKYLYRNNDHIEGLTRLILRLLKNNIYPVFVFDGKPPKEKGEILLERKQKREFLFMKKEILELIKDNKEDNKEDIYKKVESYIKNNNENFKMQNEKLELYLSEDFNYDEEIDKINKKIITIKSHHIDNAKKLFDYFGVSYIHAPCEAESLLAVLCKKKIIDCCITEDMDILAFGSYKIYRNFSSKTKETIEVKLSTILKTIDLTYEQFIEFCILLGCDYCDRIKDITPNDLYQFYYKYKNIPDTIKAIKKNNINVPNIDNYNQYIEYFKNPPYKECEEINLSKPNVKLLINILVNKYGLIKNKLSSKLLYLESNYKNYLIDNNDMHKN